MICAIYREEHEKEGEDYRNEKNENNLYLYFRAIDKSMIIYTFFFPFIFPSGPFHLNKAD